MKKAVKAFTCCVAGACVVTGITLVSQAETLTLPEAGASATLSTYVASTADLPGAGISLTFDNYYAKNPESDAELIEYLVPAVKAQYSDTVIAQVNNYVNIRSNPNETGEILGKLYNESAAVILGEDGDWYQIKSGTVTGYVKKEYVVVGSEAADLVNKVGHKVATVTTQTLKVRENANTDSTVLTLVPIEEELDVVSESDGWAQVTLDSDVVGYVKSDYIQVRTDFVQAESLEEEAARLAAEEAAKKAAEEAARKADEAAKAAKAAEEKKAKEAKAAKAAEEKKAKEAASKAASKAASVTSSSSSKSSGSSDQTPASSSTASGSRQAVVSYALKFVGNPYVAGGTSLTNGADCSGFVQSVFRDCGYKLPRSSREQAVSGREVSLDEIQAGDLLFYSNGGSINHVALYIGNGQVVHASTAKTGIKISSYNYRTPCKAVSYIN